MERPRASAWAGRSRAHTRQAFSSPFVLLVVTAGVAAALVTPWASSPLAAGSSPAAHTSEECLEPDAETFPVRINVGTYRPPYPGPQGIAGQAPGPANNGYRIDDFRYLVTLDNSGDPSDPDPAGHPGVHPLASSSPVLTAGLVTGKTTLLRLPAHCRWLVTVQANVVDRAGRRRTPTSHKVWGAKVDLVDEPGPGYRPRDADGNGNVVKWVDEIPFPLPSGKLVIRVFADTSPTNGAPDTPETASVGAEPPDLRSFLVVLRDVGGDSVTHNSRGDPICSEYNDRGDVIRDSAGRCLTGPDGTVVIPDLTPGSYEIHVSAPQDAASPWYGAIQTTASEGGATFGTATVTEKGGGSEAAHWLGFVQPRDLPAGPTGRIRACAVNAVSFPPFERPVLNRHEPIIRGWVALDRVGSGRQVYAAPMGDRPGCRGGVIDIQNVPPGSYTIFVWDEGLERVSRVVDVVVPEGAGGTGAVVDLPGDDGKGSIGIFRRFGWLSGHIFDDSGVALNGSTIGGGAGNGVRDCVERTVRATCERDLPNEKLAVRFRDGSTKIEVVTDAAGRYEFPTELSPLFKFVIATAGSGSSGASRPCLYTETLESRGSGWSHSQYNPLATCLRVTSDLGHGRSTSQLTTAGHRSTVDWAVAASDPDGQGQIGGAVYYATTRGEPDPGPARVEKYEPGVAGVPVNLYWTGANQAWDGGPGPRSDDVLVNRYANGAGTDSFEHPTASNQGANGACDVLDSAGNPVFPAPATHFGLRVAPSCLEFGVTSNETKDGTFDGGFTFDDMCDPGRGGWGDTYRDVGGNRGCPRRIPLALGNYVVEVAAAENPHYSGFPYKIVKEEDVNGAQGEASAPGLAPFPCVGPDHLVRDRRSPFDGERRPLCTHRVVTLGRGQPDSDVDFLVFTDTPIPGRIFGRVTDDVRVETDPDSPWYGQPRAVPNVPIGIRDYAYRLLETVTADEYGFFETVLPATAAGCPSPSGTCPATYLVVVNDPEGERTATGTVRASGRRVIGKGTHFTTEIEVGDRIRVGNETRAVTAVSSSASLRVDRAWDPRNAGRALYILLRNPNFDPSYSTASPASAVLPGKTAFVEAPLDPVSGPGCSDPAGPELFRVEPSNGDGNPMDPDGGVVVAQRLPATSELREVKVRGLGFGVERADPSYPSVSGYITLVHPDGTRYVLDDDSYYGGRGSPNWSDELITFRLPRAVGSTELRGAPYQVLITAPPRDPPASSQALTAPTGITVHYVDARGYNPPRRYVSGTDGADTPKSGSASRPYRTIQYAIDRAFAEKAPGRLIVVKPAVYRENPVLYVRAKLQGFGPGGINGARVLLDPHDDDVRRSSPGTVVDASFFNSDPTIQSRWAAAIDGRPNTHYPGGPLAGFDVKTHAGAGITVVGGNGTYEVGNPELDRAAIDGFAIHSARLDGMFGTGGGGGIFVNGNGRHLWLTNNLLAGNQGAMGGGIVLGRPYPGDDGGAENDNPDLRIAYNRILGNGGARWAGGIAIFGGADAYLVDHNAVCSNFSAGVGGGISHYGRSPGGRIAENLIAFNAAVGPGGGLRIAGRLPIRGASADGTGEVTVERNILSSNQSGEDGGALDVVGAVHVTAASRMAAPDRITAVNNQLTNNVAAGAGGAIALRDSPNVWIVNNTIARNASTASCNGCLGGPPHSGGLASKTHSDWLLPLMPAGAAVFSNPLLLNNLFYENGSYTFDPAALPTLEGVDALVSAGFGDFEVSGRSDLRFKPWYSTLSAAYDTGAPAANGTNQVFARSRRGEDPFTSGYLTELDVGFDASTGRAAVRILNPLAEDTQSPDHDGAPGDYHLCDPRVPSPSTPDLIDVDACSPKALGSGAASLAAASFAGTVVPAPSSVVSAPPTDIDGDARPIDVRSPRTPSGISTFDIGADELVDQESATTGSTPPPLPRVSRRALSVPERSGPTAPSTATESSGPPRAVLEPEIAPAIPTTTTTAGVAAEGEAGTEDAPSLDPDPLPDPSPADPGAQEGLRPVDLAPS